MQMLEGTKEAMSQIDAVLADLAAFASDRAVEAQILSDTQVRVARVIRGSVEQVWRAHNDADLMKQWLLGPDGWTMPVCEIADEGRRQLPLHVGSQRVAGTASASPASCSNRRSPTAPSPPRR